MTLSEIILSTPKYESAWKLRTITTNTPVQKLDKWGKIVFVSPTPKCLDDLQRDHAIWFYEHLYGKLGKNVKYEGEESVFEVLVSKRPKMTYCIKS